MDALVLSAGEGRIVSLGPMQQMTVKEDGMRTCGILAIAEFVIAPHASLPPLHIHYAHEEGFYVLDGELEFQVGAEKIHADKGVYVTVPIGISHTFANTGRKPARFLATLTPPRYLNYFQELSSLISTSATPMFAQMRELMARYDTAVVEAS